jgi:GldM N-terminal domain
MKRSLIFFLIILLFFYSCSGTHKKSSFNIKAVNDSLNLSNEIIKNKNDTLYKILERKLQEGKTAEIAILWVPKALYLKYQSDKIYQYLDSFISNPSGLITADSLYRKLHLYKDKILRIDPDIYTDINKNTEIITHDIDSTRKISNLDFYFSDKSSDQVLLILNQTKNNVESIENQILQFCNNRIK